MDGGLTGAQVAAFAELLVDPAAARQILDEAGFPAGHVPLSAPTALVFWSAVSRALANGAVIDGTSRLLAVAARRFPGNTALAQAPSRAWASPLGPIVWNLPGRLPRFVGRQDLLSMITSIFAEPAQIGVAVLEGMGGVGKSSLAIEFAHRHAASFDVVRWVPAEQPELVGQHLAGLAVPLGLPEGTGADRVWSVLATVPSWLVIFDNVEDPTVVARFRPSGGGRVLVTSRSRAARRLGRAISVPGFDRSTSVELLTARVPDLDAAAGNRIADLLGDLPLAIDQAAGFIDETLIPAEIYEGLLADRFDAMLDKGHATDAVDGPTRTIAGLWTLSVDRLCVSQPAAAQLLEFCALCDPEPVPLNLFTERPEQLGGSVVAAIAADPAAWEATVGALVGYNLARRDGQTLIVHRLIAAASRRAMAPERYAARLGHLAACLVAALPASVRGNPAGWPRWRELLPHALAVASRARLLTGQAFDDSCRLADRTATFLAEHGQFADAITLYERTLADRERVLGTDHPDTLTSRSHLANGYVSIGRLADAIRLHEANAADRARTLGPEDRYTLMSQRNLAKAYEEIGRVAEAVALHERTLEARERVLGPDHVDTLSSRHDLAYAHRATGQLAQAIALLERTLADRERVLGPEHPDTLITRTYLARVYVTARRVTDAITHFTPTLDARERVLGPGHPETLTTRKYLARALELAGRIEEAVEMDRQVLADRERILGPHHPDTLTSRHDLGRALVTAGRIEEATDLHQRALQEREQILGPLHPDTLDSRRGLAHAFEASGRISQAIALFQQVLTERANVLGPDHPGTLSSRNDLAHAHQSAGNIAEAHIQYRSAATDCTRALGPDHPLTRASHDGLAAILAG
ncbi:tetratricopeptide repeat protein [Frankia sp. AgB1.9]|uniref:tetratricopeptide repeat protein n=1 Tax=unclassified Frankia TaxID=2632575 RepID=UPI001933F93C|nr:MULTISPECIES: tetratricopeptide repeat protein [unclassified Frankia]MBL7487971.1 tetratricopeptide repeat protein [Frankia sp. AgW1.1]MBL7550414.1 tetratricopeptide repeat protein [Frankia sp. AgB1.9]MBL7620884.1 tetratricopeptide repeat protein [Frankia sp. AgB1.8]